MRSLSPGWRRRDLLALGAAPLAIPMADETVSTRRPWRKVHLDFHNSRHVASIGEKFEAREFGETLERARVNAIVVFAKDMHGYFYYPSAFGPVHPGLKLDLLGAQVEELRRRKIACYAYYCTTWDHYLAEAHPEWLVVKRDRTNYLPKFDQTPGWTALCLAHEKFVQLMLDHTREFVAKYPIDGAWFDMPVPIAGECYCRECLRQMRAAGLDPMSKEVQRRHKQEIHIRFLERMTKLVRETRPGCQVDYNGQCTFGLAERAPFQDNIDIEALPSGGWGYWYFPTVVRYVRNFGLTAYGMTGRFLASWADFGGLKLPAQLDIECGSIVANGALCDIGDQMPPDGRLDPAVYHVIGKCYSRIEKLEPLLEGATPLVEAAIVIDGLPLEDPGRNNPAVTGLVKLGMESHLQFDLVETRQPWEKYRLVILPEDLRLDAVAVAKLEAFVARGGAVLSTHQSGRGWLYRHGFFDQGESKFKPAYLLPKEEFTGGIPAYEYALYQGAWQWRAAEGARIVASLGEPAFQRSPERYTSHRQSPFDHETDFAAAALRGRIGLIAFPLGTSYFQQGYWVYRKLFQHILTALLPERLLATNAPASAEVTVLEQRARKRHIVHVVNWSALRSAPAHPVFHEEPIPLRNIEVTLRAGGALKRVLFETVVTHEAQAVL